MAKVKFLLGAVGAAAVMALSSCASLDHACHGCNQSAKGCDTWPRVPEKAGWGHYQKHCAPPAGECESCH